jgi:hypothetical protein
VQIGKVFFAFELTNLLAQIVDQYAMNDIYTATLNWMPGFMFILVPCLNVAVVFLALWLHVVTRPKVHHFTPRLTHVLCRLQDGGLRSWL